MQQAEQRPVLVFDLDETVLSINSFPRWAMFLVAGRLPGLGLRRRLALSVHAQLWLLRRKLGRIDHEMLLQHLQKAWRTAAIGRGDMIARRFQANLLRRVRPNLQELLASVAAGDVDAVLATAALGDYATALGQELGFRHVLVTPDADTPGAFVNSGARKRDRVLAFLQERGWADRPLILFTDHLDDLPLIRKSAAVCWFGSREDLATADASAADVCFVFCRNQSADRMRAILRTLGAYAALARPDAAGFREITAS